MASGGAAHAADTLHLHFDACDQPACAQSVIKLARIADIPDQFVGGEILRTVYARLNISIEFADVPGKRALALSSAGELDGEVHRIANLAQAYPTLV
jgi:polar amino acid transport system substrate-binding protein